MLDDKTKQEIAYIARRLKMQELEEQKKSLEDQIEKQEQGWTSDEKKEILRKMSNYFTRKWGYMIIHLPAKYRPRFQRTKNDSGESFKTIEELHDFDRKKALYKKARRIKL